MGIVNRVGKGDEQLGRGLRRQWTIKQEGRQRTTLDQLHRKVGMALVLADVKDGDDVRMTQPPRGDGLLTKPGQELDVGIGPAQQHFDSHEAVEAALAGAIHNAHPAPGDLRFQEVVPNPEPGTDDDQIRGAGGRLAGRGIHHANGAKPPESGGQGAVATWTGLGHGSDQRCMSLPSGDADCRGNLPKLKTDTAWKRRIASCPGRSTTRRVVCLGFGEVFSAWSLAVRETKSATRFSGYPARSWRGCPNFPLTGFPAILHAQLSERRLGRPSVPTELSFVDRGLGGLAGQMTDVALGTTRCGHRARRSDS